MSFIVIRTRRDNLDAVLERVRKSAPGKPELFENPQLFDDEENVVEITFDDEATEFVQRCITDGGLPGPCTGHWEDIDGPQMFAGTGQLGGLGEYHPRGAWHDADENMNIKITGEVETGLPTPGALEAAAEFAALWKEATEMILSKETAPLPTHEYTVRVSRTKTRTMDITVKATDQAHAHRIALDVAGNYDFANGEQGDPIYEVEEVTRSN
jgi:hypothetical protein